MAEGVRAAKQDGPSALRLEGVCKSFGALRAVDGVVLEVWPGERRAVIGPNGAGKTTLFNCITGEFPINEGRVLLFGQDITALPAHKRVALGLGRTFQITNVFPGLTVEENVFLAAQGLEKIKLNFFRSVPRRGEIRDRACMALESAGLLAKRQALTKELSHGEQRQLEIALALALRPRLLMLDEPAAGLSTAERTTMADLVNSLPRDLTILLIEHDMDLALGLADRVTCLHYGKVIADDVPRGIAANKEVQSCYLGVGKHA
ncbi:MAG TPA: ABC transporter ATP-binding protein [Anaerolineae bacterium]|nr:ABC transporter ATP-binding protein [Anaerolineae bacterium]